MTLEEMKASDKIFLTAADVSECLECDPQTLRLSYREHPELVGFNASMIGKTMRIPRKAFIQWVEGQH